jgi:adenine/guanine phosphoribosyltransferase-like PRPP-binding protein
LRDLVGLALRNNPRRAHLVVSNVLGKHIPTDPRIVYGAGWALGEAVATVMEPDCGAGAHASRGLLAGALAGRPEAAARLAEHFRRPMAPAGVPATVLGYAETATGLGHVVAEVLRAPYLHSTRRRVAEAAALAFEEEHSHAPTHWVQPEDERFLGGSETLVLVDDELSTGRTAMNTIRCLHASNPTRTRYIIAALVDLRSPADRCRCAALAVELGVHITAVSLVSGELALPADALARAEQLLAWAEQRCAGAEQLCAGQPLPSQDHLESGAHTAEVERLDVSWPTTVREGGRHGFRTSDGAALDAAIRGCVRHLVARLGPLGRAAPVSPRRILVLGFEELMHAPLRIALGLGAELGDSAAVSYSTTTRSPVLAVDEPGYAIRTRLAFPAHDRRAEGAGFRFAYNVAPGLHGARFGEIVLVIDDAGDSAELWAPDGLLAQLSRCCARVHLLVLPAYRPSQPGRSGNQLPYPLRGPEFGSYAAEDVAWLLTDLSAIELEAPTEEREEAIQLGQAHYAESLPIEYQPSPEYREMFHRSLRVSAAKVAQAVGVVTELVLAEHRAAQPVLVSLARAGTPIGVLMKRWALRTHGVDLAHYAVSIVRGRGIDTVALRFLAERHDPARIVFVDGWTGKGAIAKELDDALRQANSDLHLAPGHEFSGELAVLADTGSCVRIFGTREDFLIPSACLNSTVSGLVSRTVLNEAVIGPGDFHGAKYYAHLAGDDESAVFLAAVSDQFEAVTGQVAREVSDIATGRHDRRPTWRGWESVEQLSVRYGINNVNLVKPGVGETTRVLLRRVPWRVLVHRDAVPELGHILLLAQDRGVPVEVVDDLAYNCVGLIRPHLDARLRHAARTRT